MASPLVNQHAEGVPDEDFAASDAMGEAAEGARWRIEGEVFEDEEPDDAVTGATAASTMAATSASSSSSSAAKPSREGRVEEGEPSDGIPSDADDADRARAAFLRRARAQSRKAASAANKAGLPFIPPTASARASASGGGPRGRRLIRPRTRKESCLLCLRVCIRWPVLKHVLLSLLIPTLVTIASIYYFYFMPTPGLNFGQALIRGDDSTVRYFLRGDPAAINELISQDPQRRYPLHVAALGNHTAMTRSLISWGAALDAQDGQGLTALHYSAHAGNVDAVLALLEAGADPSILDTHLRSPLHLASMLGHVSIMQVLVYNAGMDPGAPDVDQRNAMDYSRIFHAHDPLRAIMQQAPKGQQRRTVTASATSRSPPTTTAKAAATVTASATADDDWSDEDYSDVDASSPSEEVAEDDDSVKSAARKQRLREKRARRERRRARQQQAAAAKAQSQSQPHQHSSDPVDPAEEEADAAIMSLFTDDPGDAPSYHRVVDHSLHDRDVAQELAELTAQGEFDHDEFAV